MLKRLSEVEKIIIENPSRRAYFGYNYIELYCQQMGVQIETVENNQVDEEMAEDLISIITSFSASLYGARGGRKVKQCLLGLEQERGTEG